MPIGYVIIGSFIFKTYTQTTGLIPASLCKQQKDEQYVCRRHCLFKTVDNTSFVLGLYITMLLMYLK